MIYYQYRTNISWDVFNIELHQFPPLGAAILQGFINTLATYAETLDIGTSPLDSKDYESVI
jgi:hypothetical protein